MHGRRLAVSLAIVAGMLVPATGTLAAESYCNTPPEDLPSVLPEPVSACGSMTLTGGEAAYLRVFFPEGIVLQNPWISGESNFALTGSADFVGFVIVEDVADPPPGWLGGRLPATGGSRLFVERIGTIFESPDPTYEIPAGDYRIYLLTEGAPAELSLTLEGLSGSLALPVRHPVAYDAQLPEEYEETAPAPQLYSAGGTAYLDGPGVAYQAAWFDTGIHGATQMDACIFEGSPPDPWRSVPGCTLISIVSMGNQPPGMVSGEGQGDGGLETEPAFHFLSADWFPTQSGWDERGEWGQALTVEAASTLESIDSLALWLDFD